MLTVLVQFRLPSPLSRQQAEQKFLESAPGYRDVPGLIRKYYLLSEDGAIAGGVYLWKSRVDAERLYTADWVGMIRERYGSEPVLTYFDSPVVVDNRLDCIETDGPS